MAATDTSQDCGKGKEIQVARNSRSFQWTNQHEILLCREVLVSEPYNFKLRSPQRGRCWEKIAYNLSIIQEPKFRVTSRSVRDHCSLLITKQAQKLRDEENASGIEVEQTELDVLLEEILEKEKLGKEQLERDLEKKKSYAQKDKVNAEDVRKQAMGRMGERKKDCEDVCPKKKVRRSTSDAIDYLKEKATKEYELKLEEVELEVTIEKDQAKSEQQEKSFQQQQSMMAAMMQQMQQQQQQQQSLQAMFISQQQQQNQLMMSMMDKSINKLP